MNCGHAFAATIRGSQRRDGWCVECRLSRSPVATSKTAHAIDGEKNAPWFRILLQFGAERRPDVRPAARAKLCRQQGGPSGALTIQKPDSPKDQ